jgi:effector-binding domain-containing protein
MVYHRRVSFTVEIREVPSQPTAVVRGHTTVANLPNRISLLFDEFYASFKGKGGLNVVFYPNWNPTGEFEIKCGVQVESGGNSSTPAGQTATTVYLGPYDQMRSAHEEIHRYVRENGHKLAGPSWEVYGHWSDDPAKLRTDIYYLLAQ